MSCEICVKETYFLKKKVSKIWHFLSKSFETSSTRFTDQHLGLHGSSILALFNTKITKIRQYLPELSKI